MDSKSKVLTKPAVKGWSDPEINHEDEKKVIDENIGPYSKWANIVGIYHWRKLENDDQESNKVQRYDNLKDEMLHNSLAPMIIENWNNTLQKSLVILKSWTGKSIRSTNDVDKPGKKWKWDKNENIKACELLAFKIYTDFNDLQYELTKSLWMEERGQSEKRMEFFHWKNMLDRNICKFGYYLSDKNDTIYHGVNPFKILKVVERRFHIVCFSPFSATTKREVARSFATKHGFIMELKTLYPTKQLDYAFDVSAISDYPEEHEILVGLLHPRIMNIESGLASNQEFKASMDDMLTVHKLIFFVGTLFIQQKFSMDHKLENLLISIMDLDVNQKNSQNKPKIDNYQKSIQIMNREINISNEETTLLKLDVVSNNLKTFFMDERQNEQKKNEPMENNYLDWQISFEKVFERYPALTHIRLYNHYVYDQQFHESFVKFLSQKKGIKLACVCFSYYNDTYKVEFLMHEYNQAEKLGKIDDWIVSPPEVKNKKSVGKEPWFIIELKLQNLENKEIG